MDPVSAAASIVGLLGAAAKISELLVKFIASVKEAPKLARNVLREVSDTAACLNQLQRYIHGALSTSISQEQLVMIESLIVALSNCMLIFSELEGVLDSLKQTEPMKSWRMVQWHFKEQTISALMTRMQQSKLSLSLMLTTLTCTSIGEAQSSAGQLRTLIQQVLEGNSDISRRLGNLEMHTLGHPHSTAQPLAAPNIHRNDHAMIATKAAVETNKGWFAPTEDIKPLEETSQEGSTEAEALKGSNFSFTFDQDLNNSRVYSRASKRGSVWSTASSAVHTTSWSCLSGLSLADVSELSVIGLPISAHELSNGHRFVLTDAGLTQVLGKSDMLNRDDHVNKGDRGFSRNDVGSLEGRSAISLHQKVRSTGGNSVLNMDRQSRKPSITVGGNVLEPKRIMLLGASVVGEMTICHHLETTQDDEITESERRRSREFVKQTLFDVFRKPNMRHRTLTPIDDTQVRYPTKNFLNVDTFMFVVSLISYSQASRGDVSVMQEYLMLFESVCKSSALRTVPIILLFNNYDLLRQRMKDYPVVDFYSEYSGSSNPSIACRYFAGKFAELDRAQRLTIYVTNEVEQDEEDLQSTVDELCPDLFPRGLATVAELPE